MMCTAALLCLAAASSAVHAAAPRNDADVCAASPAVWCTNKEVDKACGVTEPCSAYRAANKDKPVKVTLLYESLCGGCAEYIRKSVKPFIVDYMPYAPVMAELQLVPWGNAKMDQNGTITCQHGQRECDFNKLESCALDALPLQSHAMRVSIDLIECIEENGYANKSVIDVFVNCALQNDSTPEPIVKEILDCYEGDRGNELQKEAKHITDSMKWPEEKQYVPWHVLNGVSISAAQKTYELGQQICEWYVTDKPHPRCI